ncbi:hypothetical protein CANCADRAFT_32533 [Tortispora caseinolytica NRRL Y-17796]|uniref:Dynein heavy chain, cytoplasmic n=1 Tax=Tortispora caseinolytica NRRL Y-17796 TaxID=767744 RepID=A0A1E4TBR1_9ASCO|nr:hypothetical protein CANCADRAFT_32533 [Tortispora caseinolytica NRRL Y-17796]
MDNSNDEETTKEGVIVLSKYIQNTVASILGTDLREVHIAIETYADQLVSFSQSPEPAVLYITRELHDNIHNYKIAANLNLSLSTTDALAIVKPNGILNVDQSLARQLLLINLPCDSESPDNSFVSSAFQDFYSLLHMVMGPYLDSLPEQSIKQPDQDITISANQIPGVKKKLAELEASLINLQNRQEIPDIQLIVHPVISTAIEQARASHSKLSISLIPPELLLEATFLNTLQSNVNSWIRIVQHIAKLSREVSSGTISDEINFWLRKEDALIAIEKRLNEPDIALTLQVLQNAKRFYATVSFRSDTDVKDALDSVQKYNQLLRDFPIEPFASASSTPALNQALQDIFFHISRKLRLSTYPTERLLVFLETLSSDLLKKLVDLIDGNEIMLIPLDECSAIVSDAISIQNTWEDKLKDVFYTVRELTKSRSERRVLLKVKDSHSQLIERLTYVKKFRVDHEYLRKIVSDAFEAGLSMPDGQQLSQNSILEELDVAYSVFQGVNALDLSHEGKAKFFSCESTYSKRTSSVEARVVDTLRALLYSARNSNDLFTVFSRFKGLLERPRVRAAVQEYQEILLGHVKNEISRYGELLSNGFAKSPEYQLYKLKDMSFSTGRLIWTAQIERQLLILLNRIENILGEGWQNYLEGQALEEKISLLLKKLDLQGLHDSWSQAALLRRGSLKGPFFKVVHSAESKKNTLALEINFDLASITIFKEVRNILFLHFPVSHFIITAAKDAQRTYPYAMSLRDHLYIYKNCLESLSSPEMQTLLAPFVQRIRGLLEQSVNLRWEFFSYSPDLSSKTTTVVNQLDSPVLHREIIQINFISKFEEAVQQLSSRLTYVSDSCNDINSILNSLERAPLSMATCKDSITQLASTIEKMSYEGLGNFEIWAYDINDRLQGILRQQALSTISAFLHLLSGAQEVEDFDTSLIMHTKHVYFAAALKKVEIFSESHDIYVQPTLEQVKSSWLNVLQQIVSDIIDIQNLYVSNTHSAGSISRSNNFIKEVGNALSDAYIAIEKTIQSAENYVAYWNRFKALWELRADQLQIRLAEDFDAWLEALEELDALRNEHIGQHSLRTVGCLSLDYSGIRSDIVSRLTYWSDHMVILFADIYLSASKHVLEDLSAAKLSLENGYIVPSDSRKTVEFIRDLDKQKRKKPDIESRVEKLSNGKSMLSVKRFQFPANWIYFDQVEMEYDAYCQLLDRRLKLIDTQRATLVNILDKENSLVQSRSKALQVEWEQSKPTSAATHFSSALAVISSFEMKSQDLIDYANAITEADTLLELSRASTSIDLKPLLEEIRDYKEFWTALSDIGKLLDEKRTLNWLSLDISKLKTDLNTMNSKFEEFPSNMLLFSAVQDVRNMIIGYSEFIPLLRDLQSDCMRERHWQAIFNIGGKTRQLVLSSLTLGDIWGLDLNNTAPSIRAVISQAQGELTIEEYLRKVRTFWTGYSLDMVDYQRKCSLIRSFEEIFSRCTEHLSALRAMSNSSYFMEFAEEAKIWMERISKIHLLFDSWIELQRHWIYLDGIFSGNADLAGFLPTEASRFRAISSEFMSILTKVARNPQILEVLHIPEIQSSIEKLYEMTIKVERALSEYLEKERSRFPRFYFLGDENLLELIGNSSDISRAQPHISKIFSGVSKLQVKGKSLCGVFTLDDEHLTLVDEISLEEDSTVGAWMPRLETSIKQSVGAAFQKCYDDLYKLTSEKVNLSGYENVFESNIFQVFQLSVYVLFTKLIEGEMSTAEPFKNGCRILDILDALEGFPGKYLRTKFRNKARQLLVHVVYLKRVCLALVSATKEDVKPSETIEWELFLKHYYIAESSNVDECLSIRVGSAQFCYGFELLDMRESLIYTTLTTNCFYAMCGAVSAGFGGSPFGPAGTGKTETIKALGCLLGKSVIVFNCDDSFDYSSIGRLIVGVCKTGAWGCFDEFNRLDEKVLSSVASVVEGIQQSLRKKDNFVAEILSRRISINPTAAIFITMNPGYIGRSNLPDNIKRLFRPFPMTKPDVEDIVEVSLLAEGFSDSAGQSKRIVRCFAELSHSCSHQNHYDFGLRAIKGVLRLAGRLKLETESNEPSGLSFSDDSEILVHCLRSSVLPKLISADTDVFESVLAKVFDTTLSLEKEDGVLQPKILKSCEILNLRDSRGFCQKAEQLFNLSNLFNGVILVGPSSSGKSALLKMYCTIVESDTGVAPAIYTINPKVISKSSLIGVLEDVTGEWKDGVLTKILRNISNNVRMEAERQHIVVFDSPIDPEWAESLNSVLDDNKLLTLPTGERIKLGPNVHIFFETEDLNHTTLATISRCGIIWISADVVSFDDTFFHLWNEWKIDCMNRITINDNLQSFVQYMEEKLISTKLLQKIFEWLPTHRTNSRFNSQQSLEILMALLAAAFDQLDSYLTKEGAESLSNSDVKKYAQNKLLIAVVWAFAGESSASRKTECSNIAMQILDINLSSAGEDFTNFQVTLPSADLTSIDSNVPIVEIEPHMVLDPSLVIPTIDVHKVSSMLEALLKRRSSLILCGPPGSGKTMILLETLRQLPDTVVAPLNFASNSTPDLVVSILEQQFRYLKTEQGTILAPKSETGWIVLFCDEMNLPRPDKYGSQAILEFIRQIVEHEGFWHEGKKEWIKIERLQIVGACNPSTDVGRYEYSERFLHHFPLILLDYPSHDALYRIYDTMIRAILTVSPFKSYHKDFTNAMLDLYQTAKHEFTTASQAHYIYSPRELTRWTKGIYELMSNSVVAEPESLVRIWAHEALRLFGDRLSSEKELVQVEKMIDDTARKYFAALNLNEALKRPILYTRWLSRDYSSPSSQELVQFIEMRLKTFAEEEIETTLVCFDQFVDHILRLDRVYQQYQGHMILIGNPGTGRKTIARFTAWMNGFCIYQLRMHTGYTSTDFDADLRRILLTVASDERKVCLIVDESTMVEAAFVERMNTLLANSEIPGLFEGDELRNLNKVCLDVSARNGLLLRTDSDIYRYFVQLVSKNLHVVFALTPPSSEGMQDTLSSSPALFNRCVVSWLGDWNRSSLHQVASQLTCQLDLDDSEYSVDGLAEPSSGSILSKRDALLESFIDAHCFAKEEFTSSTINAGFNVIVTPQQYLNFLHHFADFYTEQSSAKREQLIHLNSGMDKLRETVLSVRKMKEELAEKQTKVKEKSREANEKLEEMVNKQNEAENKRLTSLEVQKSLQARELEIEERQERVQQDLSEVEPAIIEAQKGVGNIKKQHLTEMRAMNNPPEAVKLTLEAVCTMLGFQADTWRSVQAIIRRDDFIASIINFDSSQAISADFISYLREKYFDSTVMNYETVSRASKACGPLFQWAKAQLAYMNILEQVAPLRLEVEALEDEASHARARVQAIDEMIKEVEQLISQYKDDYALLIAEVQSLKAESERISGRLSRSIELIDSLSEERSRWLNDIKTSKEHAALLAGNCFLDAATMSYFGPLDVGSRQTLLSRWNSLLNSFDIHTAKEFIPLQQVESSATVVNWIRNGLPNDDIYIQNMSILNKGLKYGYVIDPSGIVFDLLKHVCKGKSLITSFRDRSFSQHLESALRFGSTLFVQDADLYDPLVDPVVNKEFRRAGGRAFVDVGKQTIDVSPDFNMILFTKRKPTDIPLHLSSSVGIVNFVRTATNIELEILSVVLSHFKPELNGKRLQLANEVEESRSERQKLEGELLEVLSNSTGGILEDENVIQTLQTIKTGTLEIERKISENRKLLNDIDAISSEYISLARDGSYYVSELNKLTRLNSFYRFSVDHTLRALRVVLQQHPVDEIGSRRADVKDLCRIFMRQVFVSAAVALKPQDRLIFGMMLLDHFSTFADTGIALIDICSSIPSSGLDTNKELYAKYPHIQSLMEAKTNGDSKNADFDLMRDIVFSLISDQGRIIPLVRQLLSRQISGTSELIDVVDDLTPILSEVGNNVPVAIYSEKDYDSGFLVERASVSMGVKLIKLSLGSHETELSATDAINGALARGEWVLLKNAHLSPEWFSNIMGLIETASPAEDFRLFYTCSMQGRVSAAVLECSKLTYYSPPVGLKHSLRDLIATIGQEVAESGPSEWLKLVLTIAWLQSVVCERQRYIPVGWESPVDIDESDFQYAIDLVRKLLERTMNAQSKTSILPSSIPWTLIRHIIQFAAQGAKISDASDFTRLQELCSELLTQEIYGNDFSPLLGQDKSIKFPNTMKYGETMQWINDYLPDDEPLGWIGLENSAGDQYAIEESRKFLLKMKSIAS